MNVYVLVEETDQSEFTFLNDSAEPASSIVGIYEDEEKAKKEKKRLKKENEENVEKYSTDPCVYFIEERPVL